MSIKKYLDTESLFNITKYDSHADLPKEAVRFTGSPRKHPYDQNKIILIAEPFSSHTGFFEFNISDILYVENKSNLVSDSGASITMADLWVKKGSIGIKYDPFEVANPLKFLRDSDTLLQVLSEID